MHAGQPADGGNVSGFGIDHLMDEAQRSLVRRASAGSRLPPPRSPSAKEAKAQLLIATMEGALLIARIRQSPAPINDIAASFR